MHANDLRADDVAEVEVRTFTESAALFPGVPETTGQAQYSLAFVLAAMLQYGQVGPAHISGEGLRDAAVAALLPRINVAEAAAHSARFPARRCADISLTLTDGRRLHSGDVDARGGPEAPLSEAEVEEKLHLFAAPVLGSARVGALWDMRRRLRDPKQKFSELIDLIASPACA